MHHSGCERTTQAACNSAPLCVHAVSCPRRLAGRLLPGGVLPCVASVEWLASGQALIATEPDASGRPWRVSFAPPSGLSATQGHTAAH